MRTWYQRSWRKLCAIMPDGTEFTDLVWISCKLVCIRGKRRRRTIKPQRSQQVVLKMTIEKQTTHATWITQPSVPLTFTKPNHLIMPDIITKNIFKCITRCLIMVATMSAKIIFMKIYLSASQDVW